MEKYWFLALNACKGWKQVFIPVIKLINLLNLCSFYGWQEIIKFLHNVSYYCESSSGWLHSVANKITLTKVLKNYFWIYSTKRKFKHGKKNYECIYIYKFFLQMLNGHSGCRWIWKWHNFTLLVCKSIATKTVPLVCDAK